MTVKAQAELHRILYINPDNDSFHVMPQIQVTCKQPLFMGIGSEIFDVTDNK